MSITRCFLYFLVRLLYIWGRLLPQAQRLFSAHCQSCTETSLISDPRLFFAFAFDFNWEWMPFDSAHPVASFLLIVVFVVTSLWFSILHCHRVQLSSLNHRHITKLSWVVVSFVSRPATLQESDLIPWVIFLSCCLLLMWFLGDPNENVWEVVSDVADSFRFNSCLLG